MSIDLVIIDEPTDNVKKLSKNILSYLYKRINNSHNLEDGYTKIVDINHNIDKNEIEVLFNIKLFSPEGMVTSYSIPYDEYKIIERKEKILKIRENISI
jgi:hypothetical protein